MYEQRVGVGVIFSGGQMDGGRPVLIEKQSQCPGERGAATDT